MRAVYALAIAGCAISAALVMDGLISGTLDVARIALAAVAAMVPYVLVRAIDLWAAPDLRELRRIAVLLESRMPETAKTEAPRATLSVDTADRLRQLLS